MTDTRFADMKELAQVKRDVVRHAGQTRAKQPRIDGSRSADQGDLARVKHWENMQRTGGQ